MTYAPPGCDHPTAPARKGATVGSDRGAAPPGPTSGTGRDDASAPWSGTAIVQRGPDVLDDRSVGLTAGPQSQPCHPRSRFMGCSISKLVVSTVVLSLVESGEVDLQTPIDTWLGDLPARWPPITVHQLLSNASGLGHWGDIPGLPPLLTTPPPLDELLALIAAAPLIAAPGTTWRYSGPGFMTAARVVEAVTGQAYATTARELVFTPAAMDATFSGTPAAGETNLAVGHDHGRPCPLHPNFGAIIGSGDLWTTRDDLIRLGRSLRAGELLTARSAAQLWTRHATLPRTGPGSEPVDVTGYGYGTFTGTVLGYPARINPGDGPGYQTLLAYLPDQELDLVVLCNEEAPSVDAALAEVPLRKLLVTQKTTRE